MGSSWIRYNFLSLFLFLNTKNTQMISVAIERRSRPRDSLSFPQLLIWPMGLGGGGGPGLGRSDPNFGSFVLGCTEADFYENTCSHLKHFRDLKYLHTFACSVVFLHIQKRLFGVIPQTFCSCDYIFEYLKKISEIPQNTTNFSSKFSWNLVGIAGNSRKVLEVNFPPRIRRRIPGSKEWKGQRIQDSNVKIFWRVVQQITEDIKRHIQKVGKKM